MKLALKLLVSGLLIAFVLLRQVDDVRAIGHLWAALDWLPLAVGFSLHFVGLYLSALRWRILLRVQGIECRVWPLILSYLVGGFFNLFLPTQVGGDVVRGLDTRTEGKSAARPFGVILVERLTGLFTLLLLAVFALGSGFSFHARAQATWVVALLLLGMLAGAASLFLPPVLRLMDRHPKTAELHHSLVIYAAHPGPFARALLVGLALQVNYVLHFYCIGQALRVGLEPAFYFVSVPLMDVLLLVPLTFSGVGLRESGNILFFQLMGHSSSSAVAFSLLGFATRVIFGVLGGIVYALRRTTPAGASGKG